MKPWIRYIALFSSLLTFILPKQAAWACGFYVYPGEYRFWLLQPDLTGQRELTPFYFATTYLYKTDEYAAIETYPQQNIDEWYVELKGRVRKTDIDSFLNNLPPQEVFDNPQDVAKRNEFYRFALRPENKQYYQYLQLSKYVEQIAFNPDPWEENIVPVKDLDKLTQEAFSLYHSAQSPFIKLRTAFQLERLYGYGNRPDNLIAVYDKWIAPVKTNSWIKSAGLYEKAIVSKGHEYDYQLSKVFDRGDYRRTSCLIRFNSKDLDSILPLAKSTHERNVIYAMKICNYSGRSMHWIREIFQSEPEYKDLPFLLLREINKIEDWLLTPKLTDFGSPAVYGPDIRDNYDYLKNPKGNAQKDRAYAKEFSLLIKQIIDNPNSKQRSLLLLYASHLSLLLGDFDQSASYLALVRKESPLSINIKAQLTINEYLLQLEKGFTPAAEKAFMSIINTSDSGIGVYDPDILKNQLILYTAKKMIQSGDKVRGVMLLSKTNRALGDLPIGSYKEVGQVLDELADGNDYDQIIQIVRKKNKTSFEKFIGTGKFRVPYESYLNKDEKPEWDINFLLNCKASWLIRSQRLAEAQTVLHQIPDFYWNQSPYKDYIVGDPFYLNIYSPYRPAKGDKVNLNKRQIVDQMIQLEQLAKSDKSKTGVCYYKLANAWYNMSYYGKHWLMVRQWWSSGDTEATGVKMSPSNFYQNYFESGKAKEYYLKAAEVTHDKKLKALCYFMVTNCDVNKAGFNGILSTTAEKQGSTRARNKSVNMNYYNSLVNECELYQSFIRQYK